MKITKLLALILFWDSCKLNLKKWVINPLLLFINLKEQKEKEIIKTLSLISIYHQAHKSKRMRNLNLCLSRDSPAHKTLWSFGMIYKLSCSSF